MHRVYDYIFNTISQTIPVCRYDCTVVILCDHNVDAANLPTIQMIHMRPCRKIEGTTISISCKIIGQWSTVMRMESKSGVHSQDKGFSQLLVSLLMTLPHLFTQSDHVATESTAHWCLAASPTGRFPQQLVFWAVQLVSNRPAAPLS